jgi:uncharacterized protein (TIGR03067 family)
MGVEWMCTKCGEQTIGKSRPALHYLHELQGMWVIHRIVDDGEPVSLAETSQWFLIDGDEFIIRAPALEGNGTVNADATKTPMIFDVAYRDLSSSQGGGIRLGISRIEDKLLTICQANFGKARPTIFVSTKGDAIGFLPRSGGEVAAA